MTEVGELIARLKADQSSRWQLGEFVYVETYLNEHPQLRADSLALLDLIDNEIVLRRERGEDPTLAEYLQRFGEFEASLRQRFQKHPVGKDSFRTQIISSSSLKLPADFLFSTEQATGARPGNLLHGSGA